MNFDMQGHVYPPFKLRPNRELAARFLMGQGAEPEPSAVPPTYMIFLRGEAHGVDLFNDLDISRQKVVHGGQRYEWYAPIGWDDELTVTATVEEMYEKDGKSGKIRFAHVAFDYANGSGERVLREITRLIERE